MSRQHFLLSCRGCPLSNHNPVRNVGRIAVGFDQQFVTKIRPIFFRCTVCLKGMRKTNPGPIPSSSRRYRTPPAPGALRVEYIYGSAAIVLPLARALCAGEDVNFRENFPKFPKIFWNIFTL